jgi:Transposase IS66 family
VEALRRYVMAASKVRADDTPAPVLALGNGKTKTGRLWTYGRDDRLTQPLLRNRSTHLLEMSVHVFLCGRLFQHHHFQNLSDVNASRPDGYRKPCR